MMTETQTPCPSGHTAEEHNAYLDHLADVVVTSAFRAHPDCPDAAIACALQLVDALMVPALLEECGRPEASDHPVKIGKWTPGLHGDDDGQAAREFDLIERGEL
jgi:hypothetical protein